MTSHSRIGRRWAAAAALLGLALSFVATARAAAAHGPTAQQQPPPPQDATVEGIVTYQDGSPAGGVSVTVVGRDDPGLAGILTAVFTLGVACIFDSAACSGTSTAGAGATTGPDGHYRGRLPSAYVPGTETDTDWVVSASVPRSGNQVGGPHSSFEFEVNIALQAAPPLAMWDQTPTVSVDGWRATVAVQGAPPPGLGVPFIRVGRADQGPVLVQDGTATIDLRRLEATDSDTPPPLAYVTAYADVRVPHANGRTIYHQTVSTASVAVPPVNLVPPSRGAPCTMRDRAGALVPAAADHGCPVTDGDREAPTPEAVGSVTVELTSTIDVADVFVTGCRAGCVVETSEDGAEWSTFTNDLTSSDTNVYPYREFVVASSSVRRPARFVRVTKPEGLDPLTEVSVWPPSPPGRATAGASASPTAAAPPPASPSPPAGGTAAASAPAASDDGRDTARTTAAGLAVLALAGAAGALGTAWARRRA